MAALLDALAELPAAAAVRRALELRAPAFVLVLAGDHERARARAMPKAMARAMVKARARARAALLMVLARVTCQRR